MEQAVRVTFTVLLDGVSEQELRILLKDAIFEFHRRRTPTLDYVLKRYEHASNGVQIQKMADVEGRVELARAIVIEMKRESPLISLARIAEEDD